MISPVHTRILMTALGHVTSMSGDKREIELGRMKLQALEMQLNSHRDLVATQAAVFRDLLHAMIEHRVDAVRCGFGETMNLYAEQARHYMSQQQAITTAQITSKDPIERAGFHARAREIDMQLRRIRTDAGTLYREMTRAILLIGGSIPSIASATKSSLLLS